MKIYKFGDDNKPAILLLPDMAKTFSMCFDEIIPFLKNTYYVLGVEYSGFCDGDKSFISATDEAGKIEKFISENLNGHIHRIYGSAFGAELATLIIQRANVTFDDIVLGSPKFETSISFIAKARAKHSTEKLYKTLQGNCSFVEQESIYNQILSILTTPFERKIFSKQGKIHIVYSVKMGEIYKQRYEKIFADAEIMMFDYDCEELLKQYPKQLSLVIRKCTKNLK